jgi:aryl-alcohol dehydrogenase-like predicted oxidoreductase
MPPARARLQSAALHKLGLGTAQFGGQFGLDCGAPAGKGRMSEAEAMAAVALAADAGVRLIDTSAQYGDSEAVLGRVVPKAPPSPPPFRIVTKTAPVTVGVNLVETAARASLVRLGVTKAAAIVVHTAADLLGPNGPELWTRLNRLKDEGLYEAVGISARAADDPVGLARRFKPDVMQIPVSLLDQRLIADGALSTLAELGVEVHLRSVFQQGLLFLPRSGLPANLAEAGPRLSRIRRTIAEAGADPLHAALAFALNRPEASSVIVGVASAAELRAVLAAAAAALPALDWDALRLDHPVALDPKMWAAA